MFNKFTLYSKETPNNDKSIPDELFGLNGGVKGNGKHLEDQTSC